MNSVDDSDCTQWYERTWPELTGNGLWLRGNEPGTLPLSEFEKRPFKLLIVRLSTYRDTAVSFTHKLLYRIASRDPQTYVDTAYLPPPKDIPVFNRDNVPWIIGTSTKKGPRSFNCIAISNSVLMELINLPSMLKRSGLPLSKAARLADPSAPIILLGGANALWTSVLFTPDPSVDGIFMGEDHGKIAELFSICGNAVKNKTDKPELLSELETVGGFIQPDKPRRIRKAIPQTLVPSMLLNESPVLYEEQQIGIGHVQISDGCPCFCSFCAESWGRKPYREFDEQELMKAALQIKKNTGCEEIELFSFNFSMYKHFYSLLWRLADLVPSIGFKSQRLDYIAADPDILGVLHAVGKSSLTCGLEGISDRLRRYLHKSLAPDDVEKAFRLLIRAPLRELKIFLIATGLENESDYEEFKRLLRYISLEGSRAGRFPRIIFSLTPLVRFPHTPLGNEPAPTPDTVRESILQIERIVNGHGFEFRSSASVQDYWVSQILVRASDPRVYHALTGAVEKSSFVFYETVDDSFVNAFRENLRNAGIDLTNLPGPDPGGNAPWKLIDTGLNPSFLEQQIRNCSAPADIGYCLGMPGEPGKCKACGACVNSEQINGNTCQPSGREYPVEALREKVTALRKGSEQVSFRVVLSERFKDAPRKLAGVVLAKAIMQCNESLVSYYWGYAGSVIDRRFSTKVTGEDVITLAWRKNGAAKVREVFSHDGFFDKVNGAMAAWMSIKEIIDNRSKSSLPEYHVDTQPCSLIFTSPYRFVPDKYFMGEKCRYTLRKKGSESTLQFGKDALRRKIVSHCSFAEKEGAVTVIFYPGPKFSLDRFIAKAFEVPDERDRVRININARFE